MSSEVAAALSLVLGGLSVGLTLGLALTGVSLKTVLWLVGSLAAVSWLVLVLARKFARKIKSYAINNDHDKTKLFRDLVQHIEVAQSTILRMGRGLVSGNRDHDELVGETIDANRQAAKRGVDIHRIQTASYIRGPWARSYAGLMREAEKSDGWGKVIVRKDLDTFPAVSFCVIDPNSPHCIIELTIEGQEETDDGKWFVARSVIFIYGDQILAKSLADAFHRRAHDLDLMTANEVETLGDPP